MCIPHQVAQAPLAVIFASQPRERGRSDSLWFLSSRSPTQVLRASGPWVWCFLTGPVPPAVAAELCLASLLSVSAWSYPHPSSGALLTVLIQGGFLPLPQGQRDFPPSSSSPSVSWGRKTWGLKGPGGPAAKTPRSQCTGSLVRELEPTATAEGPAVKIEDPACRS